MQRRYGQHQVAGALALLVWLGSGPTAGSARAAAVRVQGESVALSREGGPELELGLRARIAATAGSEPSAAPAIRFLPLSGWRSEGGELVAELTAPPAELRIVVRVRAESEGQYGVRIEAKAAQPTWLNLLSLELVVAGTAAQVAGRDLRPRKLDKAAALSGLDPKWATVQAGPGGEPWTVVVDDDADGLRVAREPGKLLLQVDLLSTEARPFTRFLNCTNNWRSPNQRASLPVRHLQEGESLSGYVTLYAGAAVPLYKARFPEGRSAALVITDHADQTAAPTLRALAGGTSDVSSPRWGKGGLLGAGLPITKALWLSSGEPAPAPLQPETTFVSTRPVRTSSSALVSAARSEHAESTEHAARPAPRASLSRSMITFRQRYDRPQVDPTGGGRPQLDDPEVAELAQRLFKVGWEVSPHSATPQADGRERTTEALDFFARFRSRTWIDHQPYTNCEALVNRGYQKGPYGIVDLLLAHGYGYAWSGIDVSPSPNLNLLNPRRGDRYAPVLWPSGRLAAGTPSGLWLFSSMMTYIESARFFALYKKKSLDQLERERGLHIAHTYLEAFHPPGSMFQKRNLMVPGKRSGEVLPHPKLEELFQALKARVQRGTLWVPTLHELGDYARSLTGVTVRLQPDGSATLRAEQALTGATFVVPRPKLRVLIDGKPARGLRHARGETSFFTDLPEGRPVRVTLTDESGRPVSLLRPTAERPLLAAAPPGARSLPATGARATQSLPIAPAPPTVLASSGLRPPSLFARSAPQRPPAAVPSGARPAHAPAHAAAPTSGQAHPMAPPMAPPMSLPVAHTVTQPAAAAANMSTAASLPTGMPSGYRRGTRAAE
ncbi:MAG: hypothetical protein U1A78_06135 [Polyangia bacterium]